MTPNKRRYVRVKPKAMSSRVRVGGALHLGLAMENLSLGGAFIRCGQTPPLHTHATLELTVPGVTQPLLLPGKVAFTVSAAEAVARKTAAGFAIEWVQPLPPHLRKGLERLLRDIDPRALVPLETEDPDSERTQTAPVHVPAGELGDSGELAALRKLVTAHERELKRLQAENEQLRALLKKR
jgi:hypothetical protein